MNRILLVLVLLALMGQVASAAPVFGRYIGTLHHEALGKDQLAKLDFVVARSSTNQLELKAVLTLHLGDFASKEYINVHFDKVRYNIITGALVFDDPTQPYSLFVRKFSGNEFEGVLTSIWGSGRIGTLKLHPDDRSVQPARPLIEPLWGEYKGRCGPDRAKIQIYTYRNPESAGHLSQPFFSYGIKANLPLNCRDGNCLNLRIVSGTYDFLAKKHQLNLVGSRLTLRCTVDGDDLTCSTPNQPAVGYFDLTDCHFSRTSKETSAPRLFKPVRQPGGYSVSLDPSAEGSLDKKDLGLLQSGQYKGYVFHEYLGRYQAATLNMMIFTGDPEEGTRISASGTLHFGDHGSSEKIPYRFRQVQYPSPTVWPQNLVLSQADQDVDAVVQITEVGKDSIRGFWYSNIFGRVGPFEMSRNGASPLPSGAKKIERLSGYYKSKPRFKSSHTDGWQLSLQVVNGNTPAGQTENPFFPNTIRGYMQLWPVTAAIPIVQGSYDFYTGRFAVMKGNQGVQHGWIGEQVTREKLELHHVPVAVLTPVPSRKPETFTLVKEFP